MKMYENFVSFTGLLQCFVIILIIKYHWDRRRLYYCALKFDGPFALPFIGNAHNFLGSPEDFTSKALKMGNSYPEIFRLWLGNDLFIVNSRPEDLEIICNKFLAKPQVYEFLVGEVVKDSIIVVAPVSQWKKNRKLMNPTFNPKIINSFQSIFARNAKYFTDDLKDKCHKEIDIFPLVWSSTAKTACETLFDTDSNSISGIKEALVQLSRLEEIFVQRTYKPWLYPEIFWKFSRLHKEADFLFSELKKIFHQIIQRKKLEASDDDNTMKKSHFLNHLISHETELTEKVLIEETYFMITASSETTAAAESFTLLVFGIFPQVQQKVYEEIYEIFGDSTRDATLEDLNRMDYLERVIKETMRLCPAVLFVARYIDKETEIGDYVYPKGSTAIIPIVQVHRSPKLWENPLAFDPDRFLPEKSGKRHRCAYIPFSFGPRNCVGTQYAMMSMKTLLSTFVRHYKVVSCKYRNLEDIKLVFNLVTKTDEGFKLVLEKRNVVAT